MKLTRKKLRKLIIESIKDYSQFRIGGEAFSPDMQKEIDKGVRAGYEAFKKRQPYCKQWLEKAESEWSQKYEGNIEHWTSQNDFDTMYDIYDKCRRGFDPEHEAKIDDFLDDGYTRAQRKGILDKQGYVSSSRQRKIEKRKKMMSFVKNIVKDLPKGLDPDWQNFLISLYGQDIESKDSLWAGHRRTGASGKFFTSHYKLLENVDTLSKEEFADLFRNCDVIASGVRGNEAFEAFISDPSNIPESDFLEMEEGWDEEEEIPENVKAVLNRLNSAKLIDYYDILKDHSGEEGHKVLERIYKEKIGMSRLLSRGDKTWHKAIESDFPEIAKKYQSGFFSNLF